MGHPSVCWHPEKQIETLVHGDDYVSAGDDASTTWLGAELPKPYEIQTQKLGMSKDIQGVEPYHSMHGGWIGDRG